MNRYVGFFLSMVLSFFSAAENPKNSERTPTEWIVEGFIKLDVAEQKKMLLELQAALASLNGRVELLSENSVFEINPILKVLLISQCLAASEAEFRNSIRVTESKAATWTAASQDNALMFKKTGNIKYATSALTHLIAEAHRLRGTRNSVAQAELTRQFSEIKAELVADAKKHGVLPSINNMMNGQELIFQNITGTSAQKSERSVKANAAAVARPVAEKSANLNSPLRRTVEFSACLYAGFIIHGPVCKAPRELPQDEGLRELFNAEKFKCGSSQVICNPLIFGFEGACSDSKAEEDLRLCLSKARPICIANSATATLNCKEKSNHERYRENALHLVNAKPNLLRKLVDDSLRLCDGRYMEQNAMISKKANGSPRKNAERMKNDIAQTCLVARPQIISILKKYETQSKGTAEKKLGGTGGASSRK